MRSKTILSIAAFIVAFGLSTALASLFISKSEYRPSYNRTSCFKSRHNTATAAAITTFIRQDVSNGRQRSGKLYSIDQDFRPAFASSSFPDYAKAVEQYVDASSGMDAGVLPREMQTAWDEHMKAWRDYSNFLNEMKDLRARNRLSIDELEDLEKSFGSDINNTWKEVLRIGRSYGADVD